MDAQRRLHRIFKENFQFILGMKLKIISKSHSQTVFDCVILQMSRTVVFFKYDSISNIVFEVIPTDTGFFAGYYKTEIFSKFIRDVEYSK